MFLSHDLYRLINKYACSPILYKIIPFMTREDCTYNIDIDTTSHKLLSGEDRPVYDGNIVVKPLPPPSINESTWKEVIRICNRCPIYSANIEIGAHISLPQALTLPKVRQLFTRHIHYMLLSRIIASQLTYLEVNSGLGMNFPDIDMPNLVKLEIWNNASLATIPDFLYLSLLKELRISGNRELTTIPNFSYLPLLEKLRIHDNRVTVPDFDKLDRIKRIEYHGNGSVRPTFQAIHDRASKLRHTVSHNTEKFCLDVDYKVVKVDYTLRAYIDTLATGI